MPSLYQHLDGPWGFMMIHFISGRSWIAGWWSTNHPKHLGKIKMVPTTNQIDMFSWIPNMNPGSSSGLLCNSNSKWLWLLGIGIPMYSIWLTQDPAIHATWSSRMPYITSHRNGCDCTIFFWQLNCPNYCLVLTIYCIVIRTDFHVLLGLCKCHNIGSWISFTKSIS